jgi:hypothetical protein
MSSNILDPAWMKGFFEEGGLYAGPPIDGDGIRRTEAELGVRLRRLHHTPRAMQHLRDRGVEHCRRPRGEWEGSYVCSCWR